MSDKTIQFEGAKNALLSSEPGVEPPAHEPGGRGAQHGGHRRHRWDPHWLPDAQVRGAWRDGRGGRAPPALATHFNLLPEDQVNEIMAALANYRAKACVDALVVAGVLESQLSVPATAMDAGFGIAGVEGVSFGRCT